MAQTMALTTNLVTSNITNAEAAYALLLLSGVVSAGNEPKYTPEEMEKDALLALTNRFNSTSPNTLSASSPDPGPSTSQQHIEVNVRVSNIMDSPEKQDSSPLARNVRKRTRSTRGNSLNEDVRNTVARNCRKIFANSTYETFPYLSAELAQFTLELYSKGICDEELAKKRHKEKRALRTIDNEVQISHKDITGKNGDGLVPIGNGYARVEARLLRHMNWASHTSCTRKLLTAVFSREELATHSLTGKTSPAFPEKPAKRKLNPMLVNDIVKTVVEKCAVSESQVRTSITTKCADESKMFRTRERRESKGKGRGKRSRENIPPLTSDSD